MRELRNIHPGEVLKEEFLEPLHVSSHRLAQATGISHTTVADIIQERGRITADAALRLAKFLGTTPRFWMGLQVDYDLEERQTAAADQLDPTSSTTPPTRAHMNHQHNELIKRITKVDERPEDKDAYAEWIKADAHLRLLRENANDSELIIYASDQYTFINTVAVDEANVNESNLDVEDLLAWSGNPFDSSIASYVYGGGRNDVWIEREPSIDGAETLSKARHLIFGRVRRDRPTGGTTYFEASQEYTTLSDTHFYPEHSAYCRYDGRGDLEHVITVTTKQDSDGFSLVTFKREQLEQYLAASRSVLIRMFDFTLFTLGAFHGWSNTPENTITHGDVFYRQKVDGKSAAYTRGVQIIRPRKPKHEIFEAMKGGRRSGDHGNSYADFVAYDFRNKRVATISTNPMDTVNNFSPDDDARPRELSPAFFNAEVLSRFKANTDKYVIESRRIHCRDAWTLKRYDINAAGQVHAYICDLRNLPYSEQIYWKVFNEPPKANISERAIKNDFLGEWIELTDPLERIKQLLRQWNRSELAWWKLREDAAEERVTLPVTGSKDEWANAFKNLCILVIEGFSERSIRAKLKDEQIEFDEKEDRSIALLEKLLAANTSGIATQKLDGLRLAQRVRSKVDAHARGDEAEAMVTNAISKCGSLTEHFASVCEQIGVELETIEQFLAHEGTEGGSDRRDRDQEASAIE